MANPLLDALLADREGNSASGFSPMSAPTPAAGARMIDFATPLPEMTPDAASSEDTLAFPEEVDQTYTPLDAPEPAETSAEIAPAPRANPLLAALQADQAATQQAVTEATTPDDRLPIIRPELADALGVLDYRDPQEGQRRQQAAAVGEILNLPMFERVNLGAAPVNPDGTVTIRRAQAVSPEAQAAADAQMEIIRRDAAAEMNPPNRAVEAYNRAERGARLGVEDVRSGFYSIVEDFFRPQQNPYLEKSQAAAIEDVPKLESRLADLQSRQSAFTKGDLGPNRDRISPFDAEISTLQNQLAKARQATTGEPVTENFLGSLSRASGDLSAEARQNQQAIAADYTHAQIRPERNKEFWMTVADSLGRSAPTTAGAILNPYLGLTLGYTQVFSNAESEFEQAAAQAGKPLDPEARAEYAHSQALLQTPFELVGDLALAKVARDSVTASGKALMQAVRVGDSGAVTSFVSNLPRRAGQLAAAAAGETLITTPAQTVIEQKLAEAEGVRAPISNAELAARTGQAMQVAGAQSLLLGGGPVALETGVTTIADGIAARRQAPTTPPPAAPAEVPQNFTPISSPAPAPGPVAPAPAPQNLGQVRAPEIPIDQAALDEAFGSRFAPPQPAPADPFAPSPEAPSPQRPAFSFSTDAITPEQTALATDFSNRLTGQLRTQGILDTASTLDLAPVNLDRVDAGAPLADFIDNFSRLTGTRIQFVKASDPTIFGGAVRSDDAQTIYLNADSQRPVASLIGHEYGHTLQYSNPALYKDLRRVVATYTDSYRTRARESAAAPIYRTGPATQRVRTQTAELTNNTLGDAFLDPEFWRSVQNENRPLIQKIWTSFNEWVDSLLTRQSQSTWGTPQFATDLTALRRDLAKTIAPTFRGIEKANATEQSILSFATEPSAQQNILDALPRRGAIVKKKAEVKEDGTVYYNGKEPSQWSPEDFKAYGQEFGVRNLGPLSEISNIVDELGRPVAQIPGGLDGKFTYYDLLHLKANAVDVRKLPVELHGQLTAKLARTMTPERGNNVQKFNGILFGMLSPNSPLLPNEFGQARMRFSTMEEIKRFADLLPDNPTKEQRLSVNKRLKNELGFTEAKSGGLGIGISVDLSNIVMASKLFVKNPDFFIKKPKESWANFVDKLTTQVSGLGTKTASFGGVWQDPLNAGISAMDRHMARAFSDELINNPDIRGRFEGIVVNRFNNLLDVSKATVKTADAKIRKAKTDKAKAKAEQDKAAAMQNLPDPSALKADTLDDVLGQAEIFGADRIKDFVNEAVFAAMGSRKNKYLMKSGQVNPNLPESIQGVEWVKTPKDFQVMSEAYRLALDINAERAKSIGIEIFPAQWTLWDRIRGRVEPHEAMFPGLEKLPALNDRQLSEAFTANKRAGYASTPNPGQAWKRQEGVPASSLAYFAAEPKPRKFTQSVQAAPGVAPEVKAQLTALDYDPISNAQTLASARARIDAAGSMDSAVTQFMGNAANPDFQPTAVDYATGIELMGQLQARGRHEDSAAIADFMARAGTTQGQAIQYLSVISRLEPAGIEAFAARQITRAARNDPKIEELIQDNQRLRAEIATAKRDSATSAIVDNRAAIKAALPAGADAVATNIAIREAILQSPTPLAAQAATARILQDNGLSERAAIRIAQSITKDFLKTTTDSRAKVLQDLLALAEKDRRFNKSKIGSLIRLNREGKLTDSRLHADMAKMLGIPAWTPEHSAKVQDLLRQREAATDPRIKLVKAAEALDVIYRESMPAGMLAKIDTFQTLMMLLNPKTWIRNIGGNAFMFGADLSADTVAWGADAAVSIVTGNRTRTGLDLGTRFSELGAGLGDIQAGYEFARTQGMGRLGSFKEGVQTLIRLGRLYSSKKYDSAEITGFTGTTFQSGIGKVLEDTLGAALSLVDRGFYQSAFRASLDNQMRLAAQDGPPLAAPTPDMIAQARMDASRAVYQDENAASRTLSGLRRVLNANQRWGLGSMLMKFTQVPGSILMRGIEFSPLGFIRNAYQLLAPALSNRVAFDQKAFTEQFSRALVGTTGLVATGYWLAQLGIISAGRENEDEKKRNLAKAEGWGSYKLNVSALKRALITGNFWTRQPRQDGDVVVNYDWAQPLSISVAMGAYAKENQKAVQEDILRGKKQSLLATGFNWMSAAAASATGAMNALVEQPLLSGLSTFFRNAAYDDIPGAILAAASDVPKSMMPTAARQWMQLDDNTVRETRDSSPFRQYVNELKSQLPGLSQTLPAKRDILGEDVERYQRHSNTVFNVLFNPSMVTYIKKSPLLTEMSQVYEMTGNPSVIPNQAGRDFTIEGVKVRLTTEEISALQKDMGALSVAAVEKFVLDDPRYDKATWDIKAKAFTRALEKASTAAKYRILLSRPDLKQRAQIEHQQTIQRRQEMQQMMDSGVGAALMQ